MNNNLKLWLVTFDLDNTQFLVKADSMHEAILLANESNKNIGDIEDYDFFKGYVKDYTVEPVDFELLGEIILRDDLVSRTDKVIVFAG